MLDYLAEAVPLLMHAGGVPVKRLSVEKVLSGRESGLVLVMDFPSAEAIEAAFASEDYKRLLPLRERGFAAFDILVTRET